MFLWNKKSNVEDVDFYSIKSDMEKIFKDAKMFEIGNMNEKNIY